VAKSTKNQDKIGAYDAFRAPWETESGTETDVDKPTLKRLVYNLKVGEAKALDAQEDLKTAVTEVEAERDTYKQQAADGSGAEAQKQIDKLTKERDDLKAERDGLVEAKAEADLRAEVLGDLDPKYAKYVQGKTKEELEKSLEDVKADFGLADEKDGDEDEDTDDERNVRTRPRSLLGNPADPANGKPAEKEIDFDKVASDVIGNSLFG
jgi:hypothetical protein